MVLYKLQYQKSQRAKETKANTDNKWLVCFVAVFILMIVKHVRLLTHTYSIDAAEGSTIGKYLRHSGFLHTKNIAQFPVLLLLSFHPFSVSIMCMGLRISLPQHSKKLNSLLYAHTSYFLHERLDGTSSERDSCLPATLSDRSSSRWRS